MTDWDRRSFLATMGFGMPAAGLVPGLGAALSDASELPAGSAAPATPGPDPWIELSESALAHNLDAIRDRVGERPVMAVIKGNGYGHGLIPMGRMLARQGVRHFAVGKAAEALALRTDGLSGMILNFGPYGAEEAAIAVSGEFSQTVFDRSAQVLSDEARRQGRPARVHVNIDTGLGRVGVSWREAGAYLRWLSEQPGIRIEGVFTALTEEPSFDREQLSRFNGVCEGARREGIETGLRHAASSAALMDFPEAFLDMVRPGISIYGHYPSADTWRNRPMDLHPVLTLKTRVALVKELQAGDSISYHRAFVAERPTRVATLPVGYSDGYPWAVPGRTEVLIRGSRFPVIALVTANHTIVDLGSEREVAVGDEAVLLGSQGTDSIDAQMVADAAGLSVYKLVIGMNALLPRRIK